MPDFLRGLLQSVTGAPYLAQLWTEGKKNLSRKKGGWSEEFETARKYLPLSAMTVCFGGLEKNSLTIFSNFLFHLKFKLK